MPFVIRFTHMTTSTCVIQTVYEILGVFEDNADRACFENMHIIEK